MSSHPISFEALTREAFRRRVLGRYAAHPTEAALQYHRTRSEGDGAQGHAADDFSAAEGLHRTGTQGIPLLESPLLAEKLAGLSRLSAVDRAGRTEVRQWAEAQGLLQDEATFLKDWEAHGRLHGAEHQVFYESGSGRWFKRLYRCLHHTTLGDYLARLRFHSVIFPETAYRLEGFTLNPKSKEIAPLVSQPHVEVNEDLPPVSKEETDSLMAQLGFAPVQLMHEGVLDDGYYAYLHPVTGVLVFDLHDENVIRLQESGHLVVIDPFICLARRGTWAAIKLAEIGLPTPQDDPLEVLLAALL
jgi:hypothetical protein